MSGDAIVVVGAQWGDEGKGKIVDVMAESADVVVRYAGGPNAGHTLVIGGEKIVLHQLPAGIVRPFKTCVVGPMVACDPQVLVDELRIADEVMRGLKGLADIWLDPRAPVILPIHKLIDAGREDSSGADKIGTTKRGIGPCYEDLFARRGVRLADLVDADRLRAKLTRSRYYEERCAVAALHGIKEIPSMDETIEWCLQFGSEIVPRLRDTVPLVHEHLTAGKHVLFEGAQSVLLDVLHGDQPNTTSSFCGANGVSASFNLFHFDRIVGVTKAYTTRVGSGPFPTELLDEVGATLRQIGQERGATTGRDRRTGWLDLPALKHAVKSSGIRELVVTKLDVLGQFPEFKVCVEHAPKPVYVSLPGWKQTAEEDISHCHVREKLPIGAKLLLDMIERFTGIPVSAIGTGADRTSKIFPPS